MNRSLQQRMIDVIREVFGRKEGAWLVWCDLQGYWGPLLQCVRSLALKDVPFLSVTEYTAGDFGSPARRREVQALIDANTPFVLHVTTTKENLGWLWSQALLAEHIYEEPLRDQLLAWGWKPQSILTSPDVVAQLAKQRIMEDPAEWGGDTIQLQPQLLLDILAGGAVVTPNEEQEDDDLTADLTVLNLTIEPTCNEG